MKKLPLLEIELNLPDYGEDLLKADDAAKAILIKFNSLGDKFNDYWHNKLYEDNSRVLNFVASLSQSVFNVENKIENIYTHRYLSDPINAKHAWYRHYETLHQPFTVIKNKCWRIFEILDLEFFKMFPNEFPSNWDRRLYKDSNVQIDNLPEELINDEYSDLFEPQLNSLNKPYNINVYDMMNNI